MMRNNEKLISTTEAVKLTGASYDIILGKILRNELLGAINFNNSVKFIPPFVPLGTVPFGTDFQTRLFLLENFVPKRTVPNGSIPIFSLFHLHL